MEVIVHKVCVLVTAAFILSLLPPGGRRPGRSLLVRQGRITALLVFLLLGLVEEATAWQTGWLNERVVAVCSAGLVAGPWVGLATGVFVTSLAVYRGLPMPTIGVAMLAAGLVGGWLHVSRPGLARRPLTGFCLTLAVSWLRDGLTFWLVPEDRVALHTVAELGFTPLLQALGTALILAIVALDRDRYERARSAAWAEVRALQARMNPHFLFNALNTLAALSKIDPARIPRAAGRLRHFLRASFDQSEQPLVPLEVELGVVRAYLELERYRLGKRLQVEERIAPDTGRFLIPPFSLQPLVENAVQHTFYASPRPGQLRIGVRLLVCSLEISVRDDGPGVPAAKVNDVFFGPQSSRHALGLLRRRLQALFGTDFDLRVDSDLGRGTTVTICIPLRLQDAAVLPEPSATALDWDTRFFLPG